MGSSCIFTSFLTFIRNGISCIFYNANRSIRLSATELHYPYLTFNLMLVLISEGFMGGTSVRRIRKNTA